MRIVAKIESMSIKINGQTLIETSEPIVRVAYMPPPRRKFPLPDGFQYIRVDLKTTAKLIRQELRKAYRLTKFSVCSQRMSGGTSVIDVRWLSDGPTMEEVNTLLDKYRGAVSDESGDFMDYAAVQIEDRWYAFDVTYISCQRETQVLQLGT